MKNVNLVDLVHGSKEEVPIFKTERQLSAYTKKTDKFFPKEDARSSTICRAGRYDFGHAEQGCQWRTILTSFSGYCLLSDKYFFTDVLRHSILLGRIL